MCNTAIIILTEISPQLFFYLFHLNSKAPNLRPWNSGELQQRSSRAWRAERTDSFRRMLASFIFRLIVQMRQFEPISTVFETVGQSGYEIAVKNVLTCDKRSLTCDAAFYFSASHLKLRWLFYYFNGRHRRGAMNAHPSCAFCHLFPFHLAKLD